MEARVITLTLEKAKEFYKKGGEFRDLALSAFTEKELEYTLPKTWEEFCNNHRVQKGECYRASSSIIETATIDIRLTRRDSNLLPDRQAAEAHLALIKLHQLRDCYRQGWKPNLTIPESIFAIFCTKGKYSVEEFIYSSEFLSFQSKQLAQEFLNNFRDLILQAGDLI